MAQFIPLHKARHADKKWSQPANYTFAANDALVPIVGLEAGMAAVNMPLVFVKSNNVTELAALLAPPQSGTNFFVAKDGRWLGAYVPAILRSFPFRFARVEGREEYALCLAAESLGDTGSPLYDETGELSPMVKNTVAMLESYEQSRQRTLLAAAALEEAGVLAAWPIKFRTPQGEQAANGVLRVDEKTLNGLDDAAFLKLRMAGALPIAYAQMLSMSRVALLSRLAELREKLALAPAAKEKELKLDFLREEDGNIVF